MNWIVTIEIHLLKLSWHYAGIGCLKVIELSISFNSLFRIILILVLFRQGTKIRTALAGSRELEHKGFKVSLKLCLDLCMCR